jgi:hypothetical protein
MGLPSSFFPCNQRKIRLIICCFSSHLSIYLSVCLSIYPFIHLSTYLAIYLSIYYISVYLFIYPFIICLFIYLSVCLSVSLSASPYIHPSLHPFASPSFPPSVRIMRDNTLEAGTCLSELRSECMTKYFPCVTLISRLYCTAHTALVRSISDQFLMCTHGTIEGLVDHTGPRKTA